MAKSKKKPVDPIEQELELDAASTDRLTPKQEEFCQIYTSDDREFFGNGVQTYLEVYDIDRTKPNWYDTACVCASQLLRKPKIYRRIEALLQQGGLIDIHVDKHLLFLITQQADFASKLGAIREYNKLKARITEKKDVTSGGKPITVVQVQYGSPNPAHVPTEAIPDTVPSELPSGDSVETDSDLASPERKG